MQQTLAVFQQRIAWLTLLMAALVLAAACGGDDDGANPTSAPAATATTSAASPQLTTEAEVSPTAPVDRLAGVRGIVDSTNLGWPREVEGVNGRVSIAGPPQAIHTMSAGIDEVTISLVDAGRIAAVGSATKNPETSSFSDLVQHLPTVAREPEAIAAKSPDLIIATPTQKADVIAALERLEIPVVQLDLEQSLEGRIATILLLGYMYGEEERAIQLADEVQERFDAVLAVTSEIPENERPVVLSTTKYTSINISGAGTSFEGIIVAAGGQNAGTNAGIQGNQVSSMEAVVATAPEIIILPMAADVGEPFKAELMSEPALAETAAVRNDRVYVVPPPLYSTNSFANVRAVEHLAHILWPEKSPDAESGQFSLPAGR